MANGENVGAAWVRPLPAEAQHEPTFIDAETPELAIAFLPGRQGQGIGTLLLEELIDLSRPSYPAIVLSVRSGSEARGSTSEWGSGAWARFATASGPDH